MRADKGEQLRMLVEAQTELQVTWTWLGSWHGHEERTESGNFRHDELKDKLMTYTHLPGFLVIFKEFFKGFARKLYLGFL